MSISEHILETLNHKQLVSEYLSLVTTELFKRAVIHDNSKLTTEEEFLPYEAALPRFREVAYGTEEYKEVCRSIKPAIEHHVTTNRHHPEYYSEYKGYPPEECGVDGMSLIDLVEMVCDWIAASHRGSSQRSIYDGLKINKERYHLSDQLYQIITNTVSRLEWWHALQQDEEEHR